MAILTVGATSTYPTIAAAMLAAAPGDTIQLESGYSNETATVTHEGITIFGDATSTGIVIQIGAGVATFTLTGDAPINVLDAVDGENIVGNAGANVITVTSGVDAVDGGLGIDRLIVDYSLATGAVTGDSTSNFTEAGGGGRMVTITNGTIEHFTVLTGAGADTITTGAGDDIINVGDGANTVTAGQGANVITGGSGADTITALDGGNIIHGGDGANVLTSGAGNDIITSGVDADTIVAGGGDDHITVLGGADTVASGAGNDTLVVDYSAFVTNVTGGVTSGNLGTGYTGAFSDTTVHSVGFNTTENFIVTTGSGNDAVTTGDGVDSLTGGAGNDVLDAGGGADVLNGGLGDDVLRSGGGIDVLNGGDGIDLADYSLAAAGVDVRLNAGAARNDGDGATDTLTGIENVTGSAFADLLIGDVQNNVLSGGAGRDTLLGLNGDDTLIGGAGVANQLQGGAGNDLYVVSAQGDTIVEFAGEGTDTVQTSLSEHRLRANVENLTYTGASAFLGLGNASDNVITGGTARDLLIGYAGNDTLIGGTGAANELYGGLGDDRFIVQAAGDTIVEFAGEGTDTVETIMSSHLLKANVENLIYTGTSAFTGTGNADANEITGGSAGDRLSGAGGDDSLFGAGGDDVLIGGAGNDALNGGGGQDTAQLSGLQADYTIESLGGDRYRVTDNTAGRDGIDTLTGVEQLRFANGGVLTLSGAAPAPALTAKESVDAMVLPGLADDDFIVDGGVEAALQALPATGPDAFDGLFGTAPAPGAFMLTLAEDGRVEALDGAEYGGVLDHDGWAL